MADRQSSQLTRKNSIPLDVILYTANINTSRSARPSPDDRPKGVWRKVGRWVGIGRNLTQREVDERNAERQERRMERKELREIRQQELKEKRESLRQQRELRRLEREHLNMESARARQSQIHHSNRGILSPNRKGSPHSQLSLEEMAQHQDGARRDMWQNERRRDHQAWNGYDQNDDPWQYRGGGGGGGDIPHRSSSMSRIEQSPHTMRTPVRELWGEDAGWKGNNNVDPWDNERASREYAQYMSQYSSMPRLDSTSFPPSPYTNNNNNAAGTGAHPHMMVSPARGDPWKNERELWKNEKEIYEDQLYGPMSTIRLTPNSDSKNKNTATTAQLGGAGATKPKTSKSKAVPINAVESLAETYSGEKKKNKTKNNNSRQAQQSSSLSSSTMVDEEEGHFHSMFKKKADEDPEFCSCGSYANELYCPRCDQAAEQRAASLSRFDHWGS
jgi:hypothetical protein